MNNYNLEISDPKDFAPVIADEIVMCIREAIEDRGVCTIVLAGGGSPSGIYRLLARPPRVGDIEWDKVKIFWGDERWVPKEDLQSNYRMAFETFISQVPVNPDNVFPINTDLANPVEAAKDYDRIIKSELAGSNLQFDLVLLGMGEDGHTASLFPGQEWDSTDGSLVLACKHPEQDVARISLSLKALKTARKIIFIVKGEMKADVLKRVLQQQDPELPASQFTDREDGLTWFADVAASSKLKQ